MAIDDSISNEDQSTLNNNLHTDEFRDNTEESLEQIKS
jgi:hypothetical protein